MSEKQISIEQWIENFDAGKYNGKDCDTQCEAGWYDWFCKDTSLRNKTYKLTPKIKQVAKLLGDEFCEKHYLFFKNNCPMNGDLYDDFRFCSMKDGAVIYTIAPSLGYASVKGLSSVWGAENDFDKELVQGSWKDVIAFFQAKQ